ncbi:conserved hypothetical protein [Uncinocarpus reesii 1704]|uniref:4Fe-4S Mo/W bis-MGD-type domain-containing protein n=1 Tax=Uncinocarpus reesii (strain UAMH 1704) TaxID=336963 RepID=C4JUN4_UNCRE|nr:uncharacterized protein UREG_04837 [Uncinocarpus reesii 1704]EEP79995.1 conserved hypothetical protein [Uncinocarpus reesii 1704]
MAAGLILELKTGKWLAYAAALQIGSIKDVLGRKVCMVKEVQSRLTNHGIAFYTSGQLFLEEYYVLAMVGKAGLNTLHMDGNTRLCTATAAAAMRESFGCDGQPGSYSDIDCTGCLFLVGHNPSATQTVLWSRMLDRLDGPNPPKLIVVDPRTSDTAKRATVHLKPKVGTNLALLNGIQHLLFKNGWINKSYVETHVIGLEDLKQVVSKYTPEIVEQITGIPPLELQKAAEIIGTAESLVSTALQGVYQSNQATASACQINNINLLLGHIGKAGSGVLQMNGQPTAQNNREAGCDGEYPGFRNFQNPKHMQETADVWNIEFMKMPHWNQPTHIENMLNFIANGSIEVFWISGTNPLVSLPNLGKVRDVLTQPNLFIICQDIYPTETTAIADVVLPAAQWGEKSGCFTNVDRTVHLSRKAVEPPGEAKSDLEIFIDFARRMKFTDKDGNVLIPWSTSKEVFEAWKKMSKGRPCDYSGLTYQKLTSGIQWPCNAEYPYGRERLYDDGKFFTDAEYCESYGHDLETGAPLTRVQYDALNPAGRAILKSAHYKPALEEPDAEYPLKLTTGRNVHHFHTRTKTGRTKLQQACPEPVVQISETDAKAAGIQDGEYVVVKSRRGAVEMKCSVGSIEAGQAFIPFHFGYFDSKDGRARAANELTTEQWDPISKQPTFKSGAIRIEKCADEFGVVKIHARENHTSTVRHAEDVKREAVGRKPASGNVRRLELWLGATHDTLEGLATIYNDLIPKLVHDMEIHAGLRVMNRITHDMLDALTPHMDKYHESHQYGHPAARHLRETTFADWSESLDPLEALNALVHLRMYMSYIEGHLIALGPASQAIWDKPFNEAVLFAQKELGRQQAWVAQHIKVKSPQTLLVPMVPKADLQETAYSRE